MKFTNFAIIDPILSIGVALFIFIHALKNLKEVIDLFLEKTPKEIDLNEIKEHLLNIEDVKDIHHIHIWSIDGYEHLATMHVVTNNFSKEIKDKIKEELTEHGIHHSTIELEKEDECCKDIECEINHNHNHSHHHHHH